MTNQKITDRKLRVLVITLGGDRKQKIEDMFSDPIMKNHFEKPTFSMGVSSRHIRNRMNFLKVAYDAGLLPEKEWFEVLESVEDKRYEGQPTERFFDCLENIEVTKGRHGSREDVELHYTVELWRKAKSINRDRSVLACVFAHLIAMKKFVEDGNFDIILEDNVRTDPKSCARRVRECEKAAREWEEASKDDKPKCHFRFVGWLGSIPNMEWIMQTHLTKRKYIREKKGESCVDDNDSMTIGPIPRLEHLKEDVSIINKMKSTTLATDDDTCENECQTSEHEDEGESVKNATQQHKKPGGNLLWGAYAYWISGEGYETLMRTLRSDVGAMLWKGKRMRNYAVKPIDKILPRQTLIKFGPSAVQISSHPAFFRAPMLTSKIHTKWDPGFCESTGYQLKETKLGWSDLWLTDTERDIVAHHKDSGKWLTILELDALRSKQS